jgi:DNA-binding HxlR family transcriptional regulator
MVSPMTQPTLREQQLQGLKKGLDSFAQKSLEERLAVLQRLGILDKHNKPTGRYAPEPAEQVVKKP